jgi:hypothetical protein
MIHEEIRLNFFSVSRLYYHEPLIPGGHPGEQTASEPQLKLPEGIGRGDTVPRPSIWPAQPARASISSSTKRQTSFFIINSFKEASASGF